MQPSVQQGQRLRPPTQEKNPMTFRDSLPRQLGGGGVSLTTHSSADVHMATTAEFLPPLHLLLMLMRGL